MIDIDPFEVLALAPTFDRAAIKRAYFIALPRHAPHADPDGFRRLRDAYETLMGPGLAIAWTLAKIDVTRELAALDREFDLSARIERAQRDRAIAEARRSAIKTFEALLRLDLASARAQVDASPEE